MTFDKCTKTIFMCHCETSNIWTHLITALYFLYQTVFLISSIFEFEILENKNPYREIKSKEYLILQLLAAITTVCTMTISGIFHSYNAISEEVTKKCLRMDFFGIAIQMFILTTSHVYSASYAFPIVRWKLLGILILIAIINTILQSMPGFAKIEY